MTVLLNDNDRKVRINRKDNQGAIIEQFTIDFHFMIKVAFTVLAGFTVNVHPTVMIDLRVMSQI